MRYFDLAARIVQEPVKTSNVESLAFSNRRDLGLRRSTGRHAAGTSAQDGVIRRSPRSELTVRCMTNGRKPTAQPETRAESPTSAVAQRRQRDGNRPPGLTSEKPRWSGGGLLFHAFAPRQRDRLRPCPRPGARERRQQQQRPAHRLGEGPTLRSTKNRCAICSNIWATAPTTRS